MVTVTEKPSIAELQKAFRRLEKSTGDLGPTFEIIASDFYKSNEGLIFTAKPGKYADLSTDYKDQKAKRFGFVYPMLVATGTLKTSLTRRGSAHNITRITHKDMVLGSSVPYSPYLQEGTRKMPARPPLILDVGGRVFRWLRIINENALKGAKV